VYMQATASVDNETDHIIQSMIRSTFKDCTVLTIAHRLNTVLDSDRIMVLDKGQLVEFDSAANLLAEAQGESSNRDADTGAGDEVTGRSPAVFRELHQKYVLSRQV
jgi:ATP-binding cassette subfamily C (CFTR/MRP) protein 1